MKIIIPNIKLYLFKNIFVFNMNTYKIGHDLKNQINV